MKHVVIELSLCLLVAAAGGAVLADGVPTLEWWTLDSGGGYQAAGNYELYSAVGVWYEAPTVSGARLYLPVISRQ